MRIDPEKRAEFCAHIRTAAFHLTACMNALEKAEDLAGAQIDVNSVRSLAIGMADPVDAYMIPDKVALGVEAYVRN